MAEYTLPKAAGEKLATAGGAFATGLAMSFLVKKWPAAGIMASIIAGGAGLLGALVVKGWPAELAEGVGAGGVAILGSSIAWLPEAGTQAKGLKNARNLQLKKDGETINLQLKSGAVGATAEAMAMAAKVASSLEF